jgi:hypothetical protein
MRATYYEASSGRFITEDPCRKDGNWFTYGNSNPINYVDATGKFALVSFMAGFLVGLLFAYHYNGISTQNFGITRGDIAAGLASGAVMCSASVMAKLALGDEWAAGFLLKIANAADSVYVQLCECTELAPVIAAYSTELGMLTAMLILIAVGN